MLVFSVASEDFDFIGHVFQQKFGCFMRVFFEFELFFDEGKALGIVGLHVGEESKNDGEESEVNLGRVNAAVRHCLCHALFPIVAVWVLEGDVFADSLGSWNCIASFSFILVGIHRPGGEGGDSGCKPGRES